MLTAAVRWAHRKIGDPNDPTSFSSSRRRKRFEEFLKRFPQLESMRVLDLGGTPTFWAHAPVNPEFVTIMNLDAFDHETARDGVEHVIADACDPQSLAQCQGNYDLVVSNSLIEHVGGHHRRQQLADQIRRAAPAYWVQTPDRYFPIEPHYVAPGFQFLPPRQRAAVVSRWPLAHERVHTQQEALAQVLTIELVSTAELEALFPDAEIWHERLLGLSKSVVAVKT